MKLKALLAASIMITLGEIHKNILDGKSLILIDLSEWESKSGR